ncbi:MAG: NAD-dependent epimerase [candidate division WOR-3 bacterium]|nr:NAD-dependent epimerase [candidate division WOR-3 bacterium]
MAKLFVTGAAGFIGFHTCLKLLARGDEVVGIDNLNDYYDPRLKEARLKLLLEKKCFRFTKLDIADRPAIADYFAREHPQRVVHLAAQAGVRYSLQNPHAYVDSNLVGFVNILEGCRHNGVEHLVYASSSSVYGANQKLPFSVADNVDHPVSLYGATKKANELMAHAYSHLFNLPTTGLRFFTVYGPWGRPDMAYFLFTKAILEGRPIEVYNHGLMKRDFTYIDDIVEGVIRVLDRPPTAASRQAEAEVKVKAKAEEKEADSPPDSTSTLTSTSPYRLYNIGNHTPINLLHFIEVIENAVGKKAVRNLLPMQPGDVPATFADVDALIRDVGFQPSTPIEDGIRKFVAWFRDYYRL